MQTIEERLKAMNLHKVQKKGDELSSQEYEKEIIVQYKKRKSTLPNITSPAMMEVCEVRDECPFDTYPFLMQYRVNKNLDDISRKYLNEINEISVNEYGGEKNH